MQQNSKRRTNNRSIPVFLLLYVCFVLYISLIDTTYTLHSHRKFQTVTAGKFKRTLTPTKKITREDLAKSEEDIAEIFDLFKSWVEENRPQLNIDEVATGETWFGPSALKKGLCDDIKTVDDVILQYIDKGFNVFKVRYDPAPEIPSSLKALFASSSNEIIAQGESSHSLGSKFIRWLVRSFADELKAVTAEYSSPEREFMLKDDTMDRVRASSDERLY